MMRTEQGWNVLTMEHFRVEDAFWSAKMKLVKEKMIPYQWLALNDQLLNTVPSHCIANFRIAAGLEKGEFEGYVFQDSDVAKWLEAVGYVLSWSKDEVLEKTADETIDLIGLAQREDGYLDTYYIINGLEKRWTNLQDNHELYCAGHMIEAGIAYYQGTGKRRLLEIVIRLADCIVNTFGPEEGKLHAYPGHEIIEMALMRLYEVTRDTRYLDTASYFIDERGQEPLYFAMEQERNQNAFHWKDSLFQYQYYQAGKPVRSQRHAEGHAVRAMYLYSGIASVVKETGDPELLETMECLWEDVANTQMYITGAVGSSEYGESFTFSYDLPNDEIYGETCAAIGLVFWARRMLELRPDSRYADVMERALYNGCISGMSKDGTRFFYVNPLEVDPVACRKDQRKKHVAVERQRWFGCACCPPNLARLVASVGNYAFTYREGELAVHLYIGGEVKFPFCDMKMRIESGLPWNDTVKMKLSGEGGTFALDLRLPGWSSVTGIRINGEAADPQRKTENGYARILREWKDGDEITLVFDLSVKRNYADPRVRADAGKTAVTRGPLVYCLEEADNGKGLDRIHLPQESAFAMEEGKIEAGSVDLRTHGKQAELCQTSLYSFQKPDRFREMDLRLVPYYLWNNRGIGEMEVWIRE